jgi:phospholipid/cholesterol/gamma-HCH transport system substrate-binding protein
MADGATIGLDRTGVPVEWDEVKDELTKLSAQLGPQQGGLQGPLSAFVDQAAATFDGNGDSFRNALHELSQTAGRLGDSRTDLFGTIKNLQILVNALSQSNEQIVQFSNHVASVSQVLADSSAGLDSTLGTLNQALADVRGFLNDNNETLIGSVNKLADFTKILSDQSDDIEQVLHVTPNGLANFYNIYNPTQGTVGGVLSLPNFANPVQFICGGVFDIGANPDNYKRAELCRERMGPVLRRIAMNYPPDSVPPDQQHHRLQGPDHLRHTRYRGQGADTVVVPAVAAGTGCESAGHSAGRHTRGYGAAPACGAGPGLPGPAGHRRRRSAARHRSCARGGAGTS